MDLPGAARVVTEPAKEYLNPRQLVDYRSEGEECLTWLLAFGKKPSEGIRYALGTVKPRAYRMEALLKSSGSYRFAR